MKSNIWMEKEINVKEIIFDNLIWNEYYSIGDELKFEGEYLNGKRHGKGKEFYSNGKLKFDGE